MPSVRSPHVLLVCTANTCRSPMAAVLWVARTAAAGEGAPVVRSAGIVAAEGSPASAAARRVVADRGLDLSAHRSRVLGAADLAWADIVFVMTEAHRRCVVARWPRSAAAVLRLAEAAGDHGDVPDPFGGGLAAYGACADLLERWVAAAAGRAWGAGGHPLWAADSITRRATSP